MSDVPFDIQRILSVIPHRYPFLLVDRVTEYEEKKRAVGFKNVTINEPWVQGHFPGAPVMPGVLILEAMAQVGAVLLLTSVPERGDKLVYFTGIDKARFRRPAFPGDQIRFELEVLRLRSTSCRMKGTATVDGERCAEAEILASLVDRPSSS
jgi:beta-hydroxyacyl-ACP dehydratase FabZ